MPSDEMYEESEMRHSSGSQRQYAVDREASRKHKRKKGKIGKAGKIVIATTLGVVVLATSAFGLYQYGYVYAPDKSETSLSSVVETYKDTLLIDEALNEEEYSELASVMQTLEQAISLNHELKSLDLDQYNKGLNPVDVSELTIDDINNLIAEYKASKDTVDLKTPTKATTRFYTVVGTLTSYSNSLSSDIYLTSADKLIAYADLLIKSSVAKSLDLSLNQMANMETSLTDSKDLTISYTDEAGRSYDMTLSFLNSIKSLATEVNTLNSLVHPKANEKGITPKVDAKAVQAQEEVVLNHIKDIMQYSYYVKDGVIHQNGNQFRKVKSTK